MAEGVDSGIERGSLSINSENIFPIIKKWLYSDTDIFIRELVSNAADAVTKLKRLAASGAEGAGGIGEEFEITVSLDSAGKTITVTDNGIGMTADEIRKYINQIAFSGASEFLEKYKAAGEGNEIIGHFGLGFYSSFMVADKVMIDSLSYLPGALPAHWECEGGVDFSMSEGGEAAKTGFKTERGTTVTLCISEESKAFLDDYKLRGVLRKYCGFVPIDIYYENAALKTEEKRSPINDKNPLWLKKAADATDDEYKEFYRAVFSDFNEPLFWIHLNMDYPFRLKGILYFPKLKHDLEAIEGQVKLYNSQIFIADNIKEVIPEFLLLLKGVIDCPDLPLNVSRSFLQNDGLVEKVSGYITKKVADKLTGLYNTEKETYVKCWEDIAPFVKYGCVREKGFYEKVKQAVLYKKAEDEGAFVTLAEYLAENEDKIGRTVYYVSAPETQGQYVKLLNEQGVAAVVLPTRLDTPFISFVEGEEGGYGHPRSDGSGEDAPEVKPVKFKRVDSGVDAVKSDENGVEDAGGGDAAYDKLISIVKTAAGAGTLNVEVKALKSDGVPAVITLSEESRRMRDMGITLGLSNFGADIGDGETLVINKSNPLIIKLNDILGEGSREDDAKLIAAHIYDMAALSHKALTPAAMESFLARNMQILERLAQ